MINKSEGDLAARLRKFRKEVLRITQAEFAERMNAPQSLVSMTERGSQGPSREYIVKMHDVFGANMEWLLSGKGLPKSGYSQNVEVPRMSDENIIYHDSKALAAAGKIIISPAVALPLAKGRFGFVQLAGTKLRMHAAKDERLDGTNLYRIIEDDTMWSAMGEPTGLEIETLREYLDHGGDRSLAEWMECFRFLRWSHECLAVIKSSELLQLARTA